MSGFYDTLRFFPFLKINNQILNTFLFAIIFHISSCWKISHHSWAWTICVGRIAWQFPDYIAVLVRMSYYCSQLWLFLLYSFRSTQYYTSSTSMFFTLCFYILEGFQNGDNDIVPHKTIPSIANDITSVCKTGREGGMLTWAMSGTT